MRPSPKRADVPSDELGDEVLPGLRRTLALYYDAFGVFGIIFRELDWTTLIVLGERAR